MGKRRKKANSDVKYLFVKELNNSKNKNIDDVKSAVLSKLSNDVDKEILDDQISKANNFFNLMFKSYTNADGKSATLSFGLSAPEAENKNGFGSKLFIPGEKFDSDTDINSRNRDFKELIDTANAISNSNYDSIYYTPSGFKSSCRSRSDKNTFGLSSYFLDFDIYKQYNGDENYLNDGKHTGLIEEVEKIKTFIKDEKIPEPTNIVISGRGAHFYWNFKPLLDNSKNKFWVSTWKKHEQMLVKRFKSAGFPVDGVSSNVSRLLRLPYTFNNKHENIKNKYYSYIYEQNDSSNLLEMKEFNHLLFAKEYKENEERANKRKAEQATKQVKIEKIMTEKRKNASEGAKIYGDFETMSRMEFRDKDYDKTSKRFEKLAAQVKTIHDAGYEIKFTSNGKYGYYSDVKKLINIFAQSFYNEFNARLMNDPLTIKNVYRTFSFSQSINTYRNNLLFVAANNFSIYSDIRPVVWNIDLMQKAIDSEDDEKIQKLLDATLEENNKRNKLLKASIKRVNNDFDLPLAEIELENFFNSRDILYFASIKLSRAKILNFLGIDDNLDEAYYAVRGLMPFIDYYQTSWGKKFVTPTKMIKPSYVEEAKRAAKAGQGMDGIKDYTLLVKSSLSRVSDIAELYCDKSKSFKQKYDAKLEKLKEKEKFTNALTKILAENVVGENTKTVREIAEMMNTSAATVSRFKKSHKKEIEQAVKILKDAIKKSKVNNNGELENGSNKVTSVFRLAAVVILEKTDYKFDRILNKDEVKDAIDKITTLIDNRTTSRRILSINYKFTYFNNAEDIKDYRLDVI